MREEVLGRQLVNKIFQYASQSPQHEVCGFISALNGSPSQLFPVRNRAGSPTRRFEMDPQEQIDAMRQIRDAGEELYAIYHSHPQGGTIPSARDIQEMAYPEALYLIISLGVDGVMELGGYRFENNQPNPVALTIE